MLPKNTANILITRWGDSLLQPGARPFRLNAFQPRDSLKTRYNGEDRLPKDHLMSSRAGYVRTYSHH